MLVTLLFVGCGAAECADAPTYAQHVAPLLTRSCLSCHSGTVRGANRQGAPREADYDTYEQASAQALAIATRVSSAASPMPPRTSAAPRLSPEEQGLISRWQQCGAR